MSEKQVEVFERRDREGFLSRLTLEQQEFIEGWLFVLGKWLMTLLVLILPILFGIYISFTRSNLTNFPGHFVGLENYWFVFEYDLFWKAVKNVLLMGLVILPTNIFFSFTTSVLLMEKIRGSYLYRTAYIVPIAGPPIIWAIVWKFLYFPNESGILNQALLSVGIIGEPVGWLTNPDFALAAVITSQIWGFGISMLIYMAALSGLPESVLEASKLDGAGRWHRIRHVIWPLLKPTTFFLVVIQVINVLRLGFGAVFVMTKGGPLNATMVPSFLVYKLAFQFNNFGRSAAMSMVLFVFTIGITLLMYIPLRNTTEYYQ